VAPQSGHSSIALVKDKGEWLLLDINAFRDGQGDLAEIRFATSGTTGYPARMSACSGWNRATMRVERTSEISPAQQEVEQ
jgi:hypothetical protein